MYKSSSAEKSLTKEEIEELLDKKIDWKASNNPEYPLFFKSEKYELKIKINDDYPVNPLYSLLVNDNPVTQLESLPSSWRKKS